MGDLATVASTICLQQSPTGWRVQAVEDRSITAGRQRLLSIASMAWAYIDRLRGGFGQGLTDQTLKNILVCVGSCPWSDT